jgi:hypothetical protein
MVEGVSKMGIDEVEAYNASAFDDYNKKALEPCPNCARTFLPDRLEVHLKSCRSSNTPNKRDEEQKTGLSKTIGSASKIPQRPKTLMCYIWYE